MSPQPPVRGRCSCQSAGAGGLIHRLLKSLILDIYTVIVKG
ncbi:MAG: hypothetical protein ACK4K2_04675 [Dehalococcoidia bacterium]